METSVWTAVVAPQQAESASRSDQTAREHRLGASEDLCSVCDDDPTNDCVEDCADFRVVQRAKMPAVPVTKIQPMTAQVRTLPFGFRTGWYNLLHRVLLDSSKSPQVKLWSREHQPAETPMSKTSTFHSIEYCLNVFDSYGDGGLAGIVNVTVAKTLLELPFDSGSEVNYCFVIGQVEDCNGELGGDKHVSTSVVSVTTIQATTASSMSVGRVTATQPTIVSKTAKVLGATT